MYNVFFPILGTCLGVIIPLLIFKISNIISNLKSEVIDLNIKISSLNDDSYENERTIRILRQKVESLENKNLCVGATFYYPSGHNFKDSLVNKRAKIVELDGGVVKSRLIDSNGDFIDDIVYEGNTSNSVNYIYEVQNKLKFNFEKN